MNDLATQFDELPPHDLAAERSTLGSFIVDPDGRMRRRITQLVQPAAFFLPENAMLARALWAMHEAAKPIDAVTLRSEMESRGQLAEVGGFEYLAEVLNTVPAASAGEYYADIVRQHAARRWLLDKSLKLNAAARDTGNDPVKIAAALRDSLDPFIARMNPQDDRSGGADELAKRLDDLTEGRIVNVPFEGFPKLTKIGQANLPGSMSILIGAPGDGKTFALLSWIKAWVRDGVPVSILMCEQTRAWHLTRLIAMLCEDGNMLNDDWLRANAGLVREREEMCRDAAELIGQTIHTTNIGAMTIDDAADWVEQQAEKSRIVMIDPLTALNAGNDPWNGAQRFAGRTKKAMERNGSSALLVTHPKKGTRPNGLITLDDIAGGQAYQGFSDFIMAIYKHVPRKAVEIRKMGYPEQINVNRRLHILKARNGIGGGTWLAADFSQSLQWAELGVITKELKTRQAS